MKEYIKMGLVAVAVVALVALYFKDTVVNIASPVVENLGGNRYDSIARIDVATTTTVGPEASPRIRIFTRNTECEARVVSTRGDSAIMISFGEFPDQSGNISSTTLSGSAGHLQAASTTVMYDAEHFGCDNWYAFGFTSTTITTTAF